MIDLEQGKPQKREDILFCLVRSNMEGQWFAGSSDQTIHRLESAGVPVDDPPWTGHQSYVTGLSIAKGRLWSVGYDRLLNQWDLTNGQLQSSRKAHQKWIRSIQVSPDQARLATVGDDMVARLWHSEDGRLMRELKGHAEITPQGFSTMLYTCAFSPDSQLLATADRIGDILLWEVATGKILHRMQAPKMYTWDAVQRRRSIGGIRSLRFSPDQKSLAVGGMGYVKNVDGLGGKARIEWFSVNSGKQTGVFESDTHKGLIEDIHYLDDNIHLIATGGNNKGFFMAIDSTTQKAVSEIEAPMHVHQFQFNAQKNQLFSVGHQKTVTCTWKDKPSN